LADVVIARPPPETVGVLVVMRKRNDGGLREFLITELEAGHRIDVMELKTICSRGLEHLD
jgi:hypothetical protein